MSSFTRNYNQHNDQEWDMRESGGEYGNRRQTSKRAQPIQTPAEIAAAEQMAAAKAEELKVAKAKREQQEEAIASKRRLEKALYGGHELTSVKGRQNKYFKHTLFIENGFGL